MKSEKSGIASIRQRVSTRTFDSREINTETVQKLAGFIEEINQKKEFNGRFELLLNCSQQQEEKRKLGTYGVISGADSFLVAVVHENEKNAEIIGFLFEKIVLFATELGLDTCWLGGTFKKSDFAGVVQMDSDEFIPIVSPVGYRKEKPRIFESIMRSSIKADKRKPWSELFFEKSTGSPMIQDEAGDYEIPLAMVRLGPSASNKQPWRIMHEENKYHLYLCRTKGYGLTSYDLQKNDMGIAKCHFETAAVELGLKGRWDRIPEVDRIKDWEYVVSWIVEDK